MEKDKRYKIRMIGNNCMPERSQAFNYEKRVIMLDGMTKYYITCKDWTRARAGVIRTIRKEQRRYTVAYTVGITNNTTRDLYTFDRYDLIRLLDIYKALKEKTGLDNIKPVLIKLKVEE